MREALSPILLIKSEKPEVKPAENGNGSLLSHARKMQGRDDGNFFPSYFSHRLNGSSLPIVSLNCSASVYEKIK